MDLALRDRVAIVTGASKGIGLAITRALAAASLGLGLAPLARAQGAPTEGKEYRCLSPAAVVTAPAGTVDVVEFFSFACPHCYALEPTLDAWLARKPAGMHFHRIPVPFLFNSTNFQPLYFALEALNLTDTMQIKVFNAVHQEHQRLDSPESIAAFATKNGLDPSAMALAYCLTKPFMASVIIGATTMEQLKIDLSSADLTLSADVLGEIEKVHRQYPMPI